MPPGHRENRHSSRAEKGTIGRGAVSRLTLREPRHEDRDQVLAAQSELAEDDFNFALWDFPEASAEQTWERYLDKVEKDRTGTDLAPGRVPATMLFALVDGQIVGRVHIRHQLTPALLEVGGHIGYGVRPGYRRLGYATEMLRQGLDVVRRLGIERSLVTCDADNPGSIGTIEHCAGVLEDTRVQEDGTLTRRYWIDLS